MTRVIQTGSDTPCARYHAPSSPNVLICHCLAMVHAHRLGAASVLQSAWASAASLAESFDQQQLSDSQYLGRFRDYSQFLVKLVVCI